MSKKVIVHMADVDGGSPPYTQIAITSLTGLTNYNTSTLTVLAVDEQVDAEGDNIDYADGSIGNSMLYRKSYSVQLRPDTYYNRSIVITNFYTLVANKYIWLEINTSAQDATNNVGSTAQIYHSPLYAIPVTLVGFDTNHDHDGGNKSGTIHFKRRFANT